MDIRDRLDWTLIDQTIKATRPHWASRANVRLDSLVFGTLQERTAWQTKLKS